MYNKHPLETTEFIDDEEIREALCFAQKNKHNKELISSLIGQAADCKGLTHREAVVLLECGLPKENEEMSTLAKQIEQKLYGDRIVMFAPLYLSNYRVNGCVYCPYHYKSKHIQRRKLTQEEIRQKAIALQDMGHRRLAPGAKEDPAHSPIEYAFESIKTIYDVKHRNGAIHRANTNIAATTVDNYRKLKEAEIGTYIPFQETYDKQSCEQLHSNGPKSNYAYHTEAMDRAMEGGADDVGYGILFGLSMYRYDFVGLLMHAEHLEAIHDVGPYITGVSRICPVDGINPNEFSNAISDKISTRTAAISRIVVPYTGMVISTRESRKTREKVLDLGISQISRASSTNVGGYAVPEKEKGNSTQFDVDGNRTLDEVVDWLLRLDYISNFRTVCYREGRTGDRFTSLVKFGQITNCCCPNVLLTLQEYLDDYAREGIKKLGSVIVDRGLLRIPDEKARESHASYLHSIDNGKRDFRF